MADISTKPVVSALTNDVKTRGAVDTLSPDMSGSQFMDAMSASYTPAGDDVDVKLAVKTTADTDNAFATRQLKNKVAAKTQATDKTEQPVAVETKADVKEKIKARVTEITSQNDVPVTNDKPLKALQKVAKFLLKAGSEGKIDLPPALVQKMQDFLAKGDNLKAADIADFMRDFSEAFKTLAIAMTKAATATDDGLKWPTDILSDLKDINLNGFAQEDKDVNVYDTVRLLKALVNAGEKSALETLKDKADKTAVPQDRAELLVNSAAKDTKPKTTTTSADAQQLLAATKAADIAAAAATPVVIGKDTSKSSSSSLSLTQSLIAAEARAADPKSDGRTREPVSASSSQQTLSPQLSAALRTQVLTPSSAADLKSSPNVSSVNNAQTVNLMDGGMGANTLSSARFSAALSAATQTATSQPSEATQQVIVQLQQRGGKGSLSVQLTPVELGRVDVRLTTQRDGSVHAVIAADRPETLALLQKDSALLEKSLQQAGINANAGNMSFNLREQRQSQQFDQGRKRFARDDIEDISSTKDVALTVNSDAIISNDRVNYHA